MDVSLGGVYVCVRVYVGCVRRRVWMGICSVKSTRTGSQRQEFVSVIPALFMACGFALWLAWCGTVWWGGVLVAGTTLVQGGASWCVGPGMWFEVGWSWCGENLGEGFGMCHSLCGLREVGD